MTHIQKSKFYTCQLQTQYFAMKALILITILCLIQFGSSIVDRTYFTYLGLKISASPEEVKKSYDQKLQKIQTIQNQQQRAKKLKLLKQAYDTLSNDKERQKYQRYGKDVFRTIKEMTCYDKRNPENPIDQRKSLSFKITIPVSIGDIYNGTVVKAKFPRQSACPLCQGTGAKSPKDLKPCSSCSNNGFTLRQQQNFYGQRFTAETICPICKGSGKIVTKTCEHCRGTKLISTIQTIQIPIPKGLPEGNKFTLRNYGDQSLVGAPSDFEITIVQVPHENWSREGINLVYLLQISLQDSLFGFKKSIQHLDGSQVNVNRQSLTTTKDTKHIIKERGLVSQKGLAGNLVVRFKVTIPTFTDEQLDMWQDFFSQHPM